MRPGHLMADCPYNYLGPVVNPAMFFGRHDVLKSIEAGVSAPGFARRSFLVWGGPGIGKTSLLLELKRRLETTAEGQDGLVSLPIYVDVGKIVPEASFATVWRHVQRDIDDALTVTGSNLKVELPPPDEDDPMIGAERILEYLRQLGFRVVLLFDNMDAASVSPYLPSNLRALHMNARGIVAYVVTSRRPLVSDRVGSGLETILAFVGLHVLSAEEAFALINSPTGASLKRVAAQELYVQSGGHPFLLQYLMTRLWDQIPSGVTDVERAIMAFFEERPDFKYWYSGHLLDEDIAVYEVLSREKRISLDNLESMLSVPLLTGSKRQIAWDRLMIEGSLNILEATGLIRRCDLNIYEVSGKMFYRWFSLYHSTRRRTSIGGIQMTIEQDALQVAEFLQSLREQIIAHPEFGKIYGEVSSVDQEVTQLASALALNYDRLQEARRNSALYPGRKQYKDDVDTYLQGLSTTNLEVEKLWRQFRADALAGTESLIIRVEQEAPKQSLLDTVLGGLGKFKDYLVVALDIKKAMTEWSPVLIETVRNALDQLGKINLPW